jgi:hypothetical protein
MEMSDETKKQDPITDDSEPSFEVDPTDFSKHWQYLKKRENFPKATLGGIGAAIVSLIVWALLIKITGYKLGWMAIAMSVAVGFAIQYFGKGVSPVFGVIGGSIAFLAWLAGNFITAAFIFSKMKNLSIITVISRMDIPTVFMFLKAVISPIDWLLGFAAAYTAYYFGFKKVMPPQ